MTAAAIIVAGGKGRRFGSVRPKQFLSLAGLPMYLWSVRAFQSTGLFGQIVLVVPRGWKPALGRSARRESFTVVEGGARRQDSVQRGLDALQPETGIVAVHDAARPLIDPQTITSAVRTARRMGAAAVCLAARDTVKTAARGVLTSTIPRSQVWLAQTPQVFRAGVLRAAYRALRGADVTDDAEAVERTGRPVRVIPGEPANFKITGRIDFQMAQRMLALRCRAGGAHVRRIRL